MTYQFEPKHIKVRRPGDWRWLSILTTIILVVAMGVTGYYLGRLAAYRETLAQINQLTRDKVMLDSSADNARNDVDALTERLKLCTPINTPTPVVRHDPSI